jgi:hypothetical protein
MNSDNQEMNNNNAMEVLKKDIEHLNDNIESLRKKNKELQSYTIDGKEVDNNFDFDKFEKSDNYSSYRENVDKIRSEMVKLYEMQNQMRKLSKSLGVGGGTLTPKTKKTKNQKPKTKNQKPKTKNQKPKTKNQKPKTKKQKTKNKKTQKI